MEISLGGVVTPGDERLSGAIGQQAFYFRAELVKLALAGAFWPAELMSLLFLETEGFPGPLGNQISFNFCCHRKCHGDDLALDGLVQLPVSLDCINADAFTATLSCNCSAVHISAEV